MIGERPLPLGAVMGHDHVAVSDVFEPVENDDYAAFSAEFAERRRRPRGLPGRGRPREQPDLRGVLRERRGAFDQRRPAEIGLFLHDGPAQNGYRQVILGPEHPYMAGGLAMDAPSVGFGQNDAFAYQARAFLDEVAGHRRGSSLPRCATFDEGVHNMEILAVAVAATPPPSTNDTGKVSL